MNSQPIFQRTTSVLSQNFASKTWNPCCCTNIPRWTAVPPINSNFQSSKTKEILRVAPIVELWHNFEASFPRVRLECCDTYFLLVLSIRNNLQCTEGLMSDNLSVITKMMVRVDPINEPQNNCTIFQAYSFIFLQNSAKTSFRICKKRFVNAKNS